MIVSCRFRKEDEVEEPCQGDEGEEDGWVRGPGSWLASVG